MPNQRRPHLAKLLLESRNTTLAEVRRDDRQLRLPFSIRVAGRLLHAIYERYSLTHQLDWVAVSHHTASR